MKNVVFIPNIDLGDGRNNSYHYSISSWESFCKKNDCELIVWDELLCPIEEMKITWQRYYMFDILELNEIDYDQIDTIRGMDIIFVTSAKTDDEARELLRKFDFPFTE